MKKVKVRVKCREGGGCDGQYYNQLSNSLQVCPVCEGTGLVVEELEQVTKSNKKR